jgi:uncharacterized C2H2 Zn-finger protein
MGLKENVCKVCGRAMARKDEILLHMRRKHPTAKDLQCKQCDFKGKTHSRVKTHTIKEHTVPKNLTCPHRIREWEERHSTKRKVFPAEHRPTSVECMVCRKILFSRSSLKDHIILKHTSTKKKMAKAKMLTTGNECLLCDFKTAEKPYVISIIRHLFETHLDTQKWNCEECTHTFTSQEKLTEFMSYLINRAADEDQEEETAAKVEATNMVENAGDDDHEDGEEMDFESAETGSESCETEKDTIESDVIKVIKIRCNKVTGKEESKGGVEEEIVFDSTDIDSNSKSWKTKMDTDEDDSNSVPVSEDESIDGWEESDGNNLESCDLKEDEDYEQDGGEEEEDNSGENSEDLENVERGWHCKKCDLSFSSRKELSEHKISKEHKGCVCDTCGVVCGSKAALNVHCRSVHLRIKDFDCPDCSRSFACRGNVRAHLKSAHTISNGKRLEESMKKVCPLGREATTNQKQRAVYDCLACKDSFLSVYALKSHILSKHAKGTKAKGKRTSNQCNMCQVRGGPFVLIGHMLTDHLDRKNCVASFSPGKEIITKYLSNLKRQSTHLPKHSGTKLCDICGYSASTQALLDAHTKRIHLQIKDHVCHVCGYATKCTNSLNKHIVRRHFDNKIGRICQLCTFSTADETEWRNHVYNVHKKTKEIKCPHCDHTLQLIGDMTTHVNDVHGLGYKKCPHCDESFTTTEDLAEHIKLAHEKKRDAKCDYCTYASSHPSNLVIHLEAVHKGSGDHKCPHCPFATTVADNLSSHITTLHERFMKAKKCPYCPYTVAKIGQLTRHVKAHERIGQKCRFCAYVSTVPGNLLRHMNSVHEKEMR